MSNDCYNHLTITGPAEEVQRFISAVAGDDDEQLCLNNLVPVDLDDDPYVAQEPWGTRGIKSELSNWLTFDLDGGRAEADLTFETHWSPITAWVKTVAADFPTLTFELEYEQSGFDFAGVLRVQDGIAYEQETTYEARLDNDYPWFEELDDYIVKGNYEKEDKFTVSIPADYDDEVPSKGDWFRDFQLTRTQVRGDRLHVSYRKQQWRAFEAQLARDTHNRFIPYLLQDEELLTKFPFLNQLKDGTIRDAKISHFNIPAQRKNGNEAVALAQVAVPLDGVEDEQLFHWHSEQNENLVTHVDVEDSYLTFTLVEWLPDTSTDELPSGE